MRFHRGNVTFAKPLPFDEDVPFSDAQVEKLRPALQKIGSCHAEGEFYLHDDGYVHVDMTVVADVVLRDAVTLEDFHRRYDFDEDFALLPGFDPDGEGYIFEENNIELSDVVYCALHSRIPLCPHKDGDIGEDDPLPED
ncbi:MAG: hypothetical protein K6E59_01595 [Bacilli bacterium]|nr:hypothetical protein [Bacilli bacterium]